MSTNAPGRDELPDLLARPPCGTREFVSGWAHLIVDPVRQLTALADLFEVGLISFSEYEAFKRHVQGM